MPRFNMSNVVTSSVLPDGDYILEVRTAEQTETRADKCLMIAVQFTVVAPISLAGRRHTEYFTLGKVAKDPKPGDKDWEIPYITLHDPYATNQLTVDRNPAFRKLRTFLENSTWERGKDAILDTETFVEEAEGIRVGATLGHYTQQSGMGAGRTRNQVNMWHDPNEIDTGVASPTANGATATTARTPRVRTRATAMEEVV